MIAPLRRRHFIMWLFIAALLPLLSLMAYWKAPDFLSNDFGSQRTAFPELLRSVVSENYVFNVKKSYAGGLILEIVQISDINPVSELVTIQYSKNNSKKKNEAVLGMMGGDKLYQYDVKDIKLPFEVTVTDTIKHQTLANINF